MLKFFMIPTLKNIWELMKKGGLMDNTTLALNTLGKAIAGVRPPLVKSPRQTGLSKASLSLFHNGKYPARPDRVVKKILAFCEAGPITCPILGEISAMLVASIKRHPLSQHLGFRWDYGAHVKLAGDAKMLSDDLNWLLTEFLRIQNLEPNQSLTIPPKRWRHCLK